jgi:hypothetical protein
MRKQLQFSVYALLGLTLFFGACKKNDEVIPTENPFASFLADSTTTIEAVNDNKYDYELGYEFTSSKAATLTELGARMPKAGTYQVTLWDAETGKSIVQANVTQAKDGVSASTSVAKTALTAGKAYRISVYTDNKAYYQIYPKRTAVEVKAARIGMFPIVKGNITISNSFYSEDKSVYPDSNAEGYLYGYPEFGVQF